jgi:putative transcriptional regulator
LPAAARARDRTWFMPKAPKWLKGQLLLDGGKLRGSFFHRTVVLICQHDAEGAFGLVLNRESGNKVGDALVADLPDRVKDLPLYIGGPVQPAAMSYLHADEFLPEASVMANLNLGHSLDDLVELADSFSPTQRVKLFAGYAGWSPGQLEDEMRREAWLTHPASVDLVFAAEPLRLWHTILRHKGWEYRLLADSPEDLAAN